MVTRHSILINVALVAFPILWTGGLVWSLYRGPANGVVDFRNRYEGGFIEDFRGDRHAISQGWRWTGRDSFIVLRNMPRGEELELEVRLRAPRRRPNARPAVRFSADGQTTHGDVGRRRITTYRFSAPIRSSTFTLGIHSETVRYPSGVRLGAIVHRVEFAAPPGAPIEPILLMALASLLLLLVGRVLGLELTFASPLSLAVSTGYVYLLSQDSVRYTAYPRQVVFLAATALLIALVLRRFFAGVRWFSESKKPWLAAALLGAVLLKVSGSLYPLFLSSDVVFQLNRLREVMGGNFFPTSVTQLEPPFLIPYPISLYLVSAPWAALGLDGVRVLQVITSLADVGIGLALAFLVTTFFSDPDAGLLGDVPPDVEFGVAAALWPA